MADLSLENAKDIMRLYYEWNLEDVKIPDRNLIKAYSIAISILDLEIKHTKHTEIGSYDLKESSDDLTKALNRLGIEAFALHRYEFNTLKLNIPPRFTLKEVKEAYRITIDLIRKYRDNMIRGIKDSDDQVEEEVTMNEDDIEFIKVYKIEFLNYSNSEKTMIEVKDKSETINYPFLITEEEIVKYMDYGIKSLEFVGYTK